MVYSNARRRLLVLVLDAERARGVFGRGGDDVIRGDPLPFTAATRAAANANVAGCDHSGAPLRPLPASSAGIFSGHSEASATRSMGQSNAVSCSRLDSKTSSRR